MLQYNTTCATLMAATIGGIAQLVRAPALQAGGHRFEPYCPHQIWPSSSVGQNASLSRWRSRVRAPSRSPNLPLQLSWQSRGLKIPVSLVRLRPEAPYAGVAHLVERHLAKVEVASSSLVTRSKWYRGQVVRQESAKLSFASSNLAGTSKENPADLSAGFFCILHLSLFTIHSGTGFS